MPTHPTSSRQKVYIDAISKIHSHSFEGVSLTTVILAPGACGMGVRAAVLDTTSGAPGAPAAPAASSKNADLTAIRVTSELATSSDTFVLCAGCGVGKGRGAPVQARAPRKQLSTEKHIGVGRLFFRVFAGRCQRRCFYNEFYTLTRPTFYLF